MGGDGFYVPCFGDGDCAVGDECWLLQADDRDCGHCLPPCANQIDCLDHAPDDPAHCVDVESGPGENLRCVPDEVTGLYRCELDEPSQCPTGHGCVPSIWGEVCWPRGTKDTGEPCASHDECISLLCTPDYGCVQVCGADWPPCPAGHACVRTFVFGSTVEVCIPWGPEPPPDMGPDTAPDVGPEPSPEPLPDAAPPAPDAPSIPSQDGGCGCSLGAAPARFSIAVLWVALLALQRRRGRPSRA
jgi:hypothetical protein